MNEKIKKISLATTTALNATTSAFNRAVQYTEEKLGAAEKTELDAEYERLMNQYEKIKMWTERIIKQTEVAMNCSQTHKLEELMLNMRHPMIPKQNLGRLLMEAGNDIGPATAYGNGLIFCGEAHMLLATANKECVESTVNNFLHPLRNFLEVDMKKILKEKTNLEKTRLDLDACKHHLRKENPDGKDALEAELKMRQEEFGRQMHICKTLLQGIDKTYANHLQFLKEFAKTKVNFFSQALKIMVDFQKEMERFVPQTDGGN